MFLPHPRVKVSIVGSLRDRETACSASDRQVSNFESCVWRTVSSQSSHHPQEVLLAQLSLYVHKGGLKPVRESGTQPHWFINWLIVWLIILSLNKICYKFNVVLIHRHKRASTPIQHITLFLMKSVYFTFICHEVYLCDVGAQRFNPIRSL